MYILKTEQSFDSAHFLSGYDGKCSNIHGHRWTVEIEIQSETLNSTGKLRGMIVDFGDLKKDLKSIVDFYDHSLIIEQNSMKLETLNNLKNDGFRIIEVEFRPTAENLAYHFFNLMEQKGYDVRKSTVYETPNNCATFQK
ncbi:6-pyruvoyl tetrahydropterin synthase [Clostridium novyi A str. 4570]|uniref:6-carboxy-5,6,7,8-tetrahydropterin synthase n=1 Tax=Clostridium novyi A str. 4570 TaxID=1444290 RepID=A0AA89CT35_CLONO|nr:6-carboxytetrahydropterin synthase QueD [Clostridium novyi]KGN01735.1 6-pyruvoyl tetrahydropterin synthase [Clostridium novyi A str. 4570]